MVLGKSLNLSVPQFSHLSEGMIITSRSAVRIKGVRARNGWAQCLVPGVTQLSAVITVMIIIVIITVSQMEE